MLIDKKTLDLIKSVVEDKKAPSYMRALLVDFDNNSYGVTGVDMSFTSCPVEEFSPTHIISFDALEAAFKEVPTKDGSGPLKKVARLSSDIVEVYGMPSKTAGDMNLAKAFTEENDSYCLCTVSAIDKEPGISEAVQELLQVLCARREEQVEPSAHLLSTNFLKAATCLAKACDKSHVEASLHPSGAMTVQANDFILFCSPLRK